MRHLYKETTELSIVYSRPLKRFLSFCLDIVVFLIFSMMVFGGASQNIISKFDSYKKTYANQEAAINEMNSMYVDSHLSIKVDEEFSIDTALEKYLVNKLQDKDEIEGTLTDNFVFFYTVYAPIKLTDKDGNKVSYTVEQVNEEIYGMKNPSEVVIWEYQSGNKNLPLHLTSEAKTQINRYRSNEIDAQSEKYYVAYNNQIKKISEDACNYLLNSQEYIAAKDKFNKNYYEHLINYSVSSVITYTLCFAFYYVVMPLLLGDGMTLGKFLLKYNVFSVDRHYVRKKNVILRAVFQYICYFFTVGIIPFLQLGLNTFKMPFIIVGDYTLTMIIPILVSFLLSVISFCVMCTSGRWQSLAEMCSKTIVGKIEDKPIDEAEANEYGR